MAKYQRQIPIGLRRHYARVGAAAAAAATPAAAPPPTQPGFAPVFKGWNVWDIWQADDPTFDIMMVGVPLDRQLRIWVENYLDENAPGSDIADPWNPNPKKWKGEQVQIIPPVTGLQIAALRADIPELAGAMTIGSSGSKATKKTVRFWNRSSATSMPWAHDENYLLETVYTPSASNSVTNAPQPSSFAKTASEAAEASGSALKIVAIVGGVVLVGGVIIALASASKKAAA